MSKTLFAELKRVGIDEELAAKVSASLDPDYNASKKDVLVMQEAIMQVELRNDARYHELNNKVEAVKSEMHQDFASVRTDLASMRTEMASLNRHTS